MVDVRKFIGEIRQRRALWDIRHPTYHDKYKLYCGWREISEMFNISVPAAKQKWKNLRDTFRVEVKKQMKKATEDLAEGIKREPYLPMWQHYDDMVFLKDLLKTRRDAMIDQEKIFEQFQNSSLDITGGESSNDNATEQDIKIEYCELIPTLNELDRFSPSADDGDVSFDRKAFQAYAEEKRNKRKRQEEHGETVEQDDDLLFFRSLIPYVKRLPDDKRLIFRTSVQQLLYNELYSE